MISEHSQRGVVLTPSYNRADYLEQTQRSVLLQGYPNLELIVIEAGSNDHNLDNRRARNRGYNGLAPARADRLVAGLCSILSGVATLPLVLVTGVGDAQTSKPKDQPIDWPAWVPLNQYVLQRSLCD